MDDQRVVVEIVNFVDLNNHDQESSGSSSSLTLTMADEEAVLQESVIVLKPDFDGNEKEGGLLEKSPSCVVNVKLDSKDNGDSHGSVYWDMDDHSVVIVKEKSFDSNNLDQESSESSSSLVMGDEQEVVQESEIVEGSEGVEGVKSEGSFDHNEKDKGVLEENVAEGNELKDEKSLSCVVDMVCRICHLSSDQTPERCDASNDSNVKELSLVQLGCGCKDELGVAHSHCANTWFKLKGNRICEVCGEAARNITDIIQEPRLMDWTEQRSYGSGRNHSLDTSGGWWRGQSCCNFLMACLIAAFVLPWFFRVNIF